MPTTEVVNPDVSSSSANLMLEQRRVIGAPRARVYEAWTNPEVLKRWFGPEQMQCPSAALDVRVGGSYRIEMVPNERPPAATAGAGCDERRAAAVGVYTDVIPEERLQFTWAPDWNPGEESLVTVLLRDVPGGTEVTIRHERFATEASRNGHEQGWAGSLAKLAELMRS